MGVNHHQIPVDCPGGAKLVRTYHGDGAMRVDASSSALETHGSLEKTTPRTGCSDSPTA
ncbi:hypothetical protein [Mycobacterium sp. Aquia_216]|uniref:hypothetical protein n=1 Tax=Mycobacterium sp. Aquia_216 TaxID=2991729 RepID=UPI003FA356B2